MARSVLLPIRGKRYASMSKNAEVVHFQQILNAYGSQVVFSWLQQPSNARRIVTIHELDVDQLKNPKRNELYNLADGIIVHCEEMKQHLIRLGVQQERIHIVLHGTSIPAPLPDNSREGIVFYGGHKLMSGKGIDALFKAWSIIQQKNGGSYASPEDPRTLRNRHPEEALRLAAQHGIADKIVWLNQIPEEESVRLYQRSLLCVLPYTGSFAGYAASLAAACQLPIVCTRKAGLPDHLGETAVWVDENSPEPLAERIIELLNNEPQRRQLGSQLLKRAESFLQWDVIADQTLKIYEDTILKKTGQHLDESDPVTAQAV